MKKVLALLFVLTLAACSGGDAPEAPAASEPAAISAPSDGSQAETTQAAEAPAADGEAAEEATPDLGPALALQAEGSSLGFVARKNDEADVAGTFKTLSGTMHVPGGDLSKAAGTIEIGWVGNIDTGDAARDNSLITVFFAAVDDAAPKGQVGLNNLEVETPMLEVGASTTGNAFVDVGAGVSMTGLAVPVKVTRSGESQYSIELPEGAEVSIEKLGMNERKATLMTVCNHKSVGDTVKISGAFVFGE